VSIAERGGEAWRAPVKGLRLPSALLTGVNTRLPDGRLLVMKEISRVADINGPTQVPHLSELAFPRNQDIVGCGEPSLPRRNISLCLLNAVGLRTCFLAWRRDLAKPTRPPCPRCGTCSPCRSATGLDLLRNKPTTIWQRCYRPKAATQP